jgi:isopentenyl-diphosphate delta-isomerase
MIFTVDEENNPIEPVERQKAHQEGIWHRTTDIAVMNSKNEILCHKRSIFKDTNAGKWDPCFGGHILAGTSPIQGAIIELGEESGLKPAEDDLQFVTIAKDSRYNGKNNEFRYCYLYRWDGDSAQLKLEKEEVEEVKWVPIDVVVANRNNDGEWCSMPYLDELLKKLAI